MAESDEVFRIERQRRLENGARFLTFAGLEERLSVDDVPAHMAGLLWQVLLADADRFLEIPGEDFGPKQISPARDTRFVWMQSVIRCTHYVAGASEQHYINKADAPEVTFVRRDDISDSDKAYTEL